MLLLPSSELLTKANGDIKTLKNINQFNRVHNSSLPFICTIEWKKYIYI